MSKRHKRFFWILIVCFGLTLLPISILNLILINKTSSSDEHTKLASDWQQATGGIVNAPSDQENSRLKTLRLRDRLHEINTVILGASTTFGISQNMFPEPIRIYNFSKNGVGLSTMIGEAEYLLNNTENIKWLVIPLDWSVGFIYEDDPPSHYSNLFIDSPQPALQQTFWLQKLQDSLSYPRIVGLFKLFKNIWIADHKYSAFRQIFLQPASDEYLCPDGTRAKDFGIQNRGGCTGFYNDGSWTYNSADRVGNAHRLVMLATASESKYPQNLLKKKGVPNPLYLKRMAALSQQAENRGGKIIFLMPPLLIGMSAEFMRHPQWSIYLSRTRQLLFDWAKEENLALIDAEQSEKFGCTTDEFTDEHHATQGCYQKIFSAFWQNTEKSIGESNRTVDRKNRP
jgi:hypothetical protein